MTATRRTGSGSRGPVSFRLPDDGSTVELRFADRFVTARSPETSTTTTFYDTFDWRIHGRGHTYETTGMGAGRVHTLRAADGRVLFRRRDAGEPGFASDVPPGAFRDELTSCLSMRRLLPVVELELRVRALSVLDDEEKTTVRVRFEAGTCRDPVRGVEHPFEPVARVLPVRGYDAEREEVVEFLRADCGLADAEGSEIAQALAPLGREPGDYTSKFSLALNPAMPAADAARTIHLSLLGTMLRNEEGTRKDLDSEFLHDFRVAIRRTRSALTQVREVYAPEIVERFKEEFRWLGSETGPVRDLDVWRLKMDSYRDDLPEEAREDLTPLADYLRKRQRTAHRRLVGALDTERYRRLVSDWRAFLTKGSEGPGPANAKRPILSVASERIWRVYRGVVKHGRRIDDATPADALHDVRIRAKKLRYLLEFFRSLYPEDAVGRLVSELKKLQDNLGDFNDYQVQRESLERYAAEMAAADEAPVRTHLAMGRLLDRLDAGKAAERRRFGKRFARFASPENRETFERLYGWRSAP